MTMPDLPGSAIPTPEAALVEVDTDQPHSGG
jgi:hypothetical protein